MRKQSKYDRINISDIYHNPQTSSKVFYGNNQQQSSDLIAKSMHSSAHIIPQEMMYKISGRRDKNVSSSVEDYTRINNNNGFVDSPGQLRQNAQPYKVPHQKTPQKRFFVGINRNSLEHPPTSMGFVSTQKKQSLPQISHHRVSRSIHGSVVNSIIYDENQDQQHAQYDNLMSVTNKFTNLSPQEQFRQQHLKHFMKHTKMNKKLPTGYPNDLRRSQELYSNQNTGSRRMSSNQQQLLEFSTKSNQISSQRGQVENAILIQSDDDDEELNEYVSKKKREMFSPKAIQMFDKDQASQLYNYVQKKQGQLDAQHNKRQKHINQLKFKALQAQQLEQLADKSSPDKFRKQSVDQDDDNQSDSEEDWEAMVQKKGKKSPQKEENKYSKKLHKVLAKFNEQSSDSEDNAYATEPQILPVIRTEPSKQEINFTKVVGNNKRKLQVREAVEKAPEKLKVDVFNFLKDNDKISVFDILKNIDYDQEKFIDISKMQGNKSTSFVGDKQVFDSYAEWVKQLRLKRAREEQASSEHINHFSYEDDHVREVIHSTNEQKFSKKIQDLKFDLDSKNILVSKMAQIETTKLKELAMHKHDEDDLKRYIKYLMGMKQIPVDNFTINKEYFSQKFELNKKNLNLPFDEYAYQEENSMKTVANDIIERVDYNKVISEAFNPISEVKFQNNPKYAYYNICQKDQDLALPMLARITNKNLYLSNYQLSKGHCKALARTFDYNSDFISKIYLRNCGLHDENFSILLKGFLKLDAMNQITYTRGGFGVRSIEAIKPLLVRPFPSNLQYLRIIDCKLTVPILLDLFVALREKSNLKGITLMNTNLHERAVQQLAEYVAEARKIQELDISWNNLRPHNYTNLINVFGAHRSLVYINLSYNKIFEEEKADHDFNATQTIESAKNEEEKEKFPYGKPKLHELNQNLLAGFSECIKRNKSIQHINLTSTGLNSYAIHKLGVDMRRAKSLLSIHFSGNPGVTPQLKEHLNTALHFKPQMEQKLIDFERIEKEVGMNRKSTLQAQQRRMSVLRTEPDVAQETIKIKQIMTRKRYESKENNFSGEASQKDTKLILQRYLGHKQDIPGSGQWQMLDQVHQNCWICDQEIYTLIFWDKLITGQTQKETSYQALISKFLDILQQEVGVTENQIIEIHKQAPKVPLIFLKSNNWNPKPMMNIIDYQKILGGSDVTDDKILSQMADKGWAISTQQSYEDLEPYQIDPYNKVKDKLNEIEVQKWKTIVSKNCRFRNPHLVNVESTAVKEPHRNLFVAPTFFQTGKHDFIISFMNETTGKVEYYHNKTICDIRPEEIPPFVKTSDKKVFRREFRKEHSVFAAWKEDNNTILKNAFAADKDNWKLAKLIKDPDDYKLTQEYLFRNLAKLKDIHLDVSTNSTWPFITWIEMSSFSEKCTYVDSWTKLANIDLIFVSTNQGNRGQVKNKSGLLRCEFLEILVRIAKQKFIEQNIVKTFNEAIKKLCQEHIFPAHENMHPWQQFRIDELYCLEVNDVMQANLAGIKKMYKFYETATQKFMSNKDAIAFMTKDTDLELTTKQAKLALAYSKMTTVDEFNDFNKILKLELVEFYEMIGRIASVKFKETELEFNPLCERIEYVLDMCLPLVETQRIEVNINHESQSESDNDY